MNSMWVPLLYLGCCLCKHIHKPKKYTLVCISFFFFSVVTHFRSSTTKHSLVSSGDKHEPHVQVLRTLRLSQATIYKRMSYTWSYTYVHSPWWDPRQPPLYPRLWLCSGTEKKQQTLPSRCYNIKIPEQTGSAKHARSKLTRDCSLLAAERNSSWGMHAGHSWDHKGCV